MQFAQHRSLLALPAVRALLIQCVCMLPVLFGSLLFPAMSFGQAALLQGGLAAVSSAALALPVWWWLIQLLFPVMLLTVHAAGLPSWLFMLLFLLLFSVFWASYRTRVPLFLSGRCAWERVASLLPGGAIRVLDAGSGIGGLVLHIARLRPESQLVGAEIAPLPWLVSRIRGWLSGSSARFLLADYETLDLARFNVIFAYLSPAAMPALWRQASEQMQAGSLLLSYEFVVPGVEPDFQHPCGARMLYGWNI